MELTNEQWTALGKRAILIEERAHDALYAVISRDYARYTTCMGMVQADAIFAADMIRERAHQAYPCNQRDGDSEGGC